MNKLKFITLFLTAGLFFAQCSSNKKVASNTDKKIDDVSIVASLNNKFSVEQINEGKTIYESSCKKCHELYAPESRDIAAWEYILPKMYVRTELNKDEVAKMRAYLLTHAKRKA